MRKRLLVLTILALGAGAVAAPAQADSAPSRPVETGSSQQVQARLGYRVPPGLGTEADPTACTQAADATVSYAASLSGRQEVPVPGGPAVGDPEGHALVLVEICGDDVSFAFQWRGISAPTMGHIHEGKRGVNGPVVIPLFTSAMPASLSAAVGAVTMVDDAGLAAAIQADPSSFYANLHTADFPGGAVRGQLKPVNGPADLLGLVHGDRMRTLLDGQQEVTAAGVEGAGDPDGYAIAFIRPRRSRVEFGAVWVGLAAPTMGHIHLGRPLANGGVVVPLFTTAVPDGIFAIAGEVDAVDPGTTRQIRRDPGDYYVNLHTSEFPAGAVRGQLG